MKPIPDVVAERAHNNITVDPNTGCWESNYSRQRAGYAVVTHKHGDEASSFLAHRASWTHARGPIAEGMTIDHQCYNRACVNPDHLREISLAENSRRRNGEDWPLGQCKNGHPDSFQREVVWSGRKRRMCGQCLKDRNAIANAARSKAKMGGT